MDSIREPDDNTPSLPDVIAKTMIISQSKSKLTDSGSYQANSGPTLQGRPPHELTAWNALLDEHLDGTEGAKPAADLGESLQRVPHPTDNQTTAIITERRDASQLAIELDDRVLVVSHRIGVALPLVILTSSAQCSPRPSLGFTSPRHLPGSSTQLITQLRPVTNLFPSRNVLSSRELQETGSNTLLGPLGSYETREGDESSSQVHSPRERIGIRPHAD